MSIQITGLNFDTGEALRTYIGEQLETAVRKYVDMPMTGHVRVEKEGINFVTDCLIHLQSGLLLQSRDENPDPYLSVDGALARLEKRVRRYKRRLKNHNDSRRNGERDAAAGRYYVIQEPIAGDDADPTDEIVEDQPHGGLIVAEMETPIRAFSVSDAVMALDLSDGPVLVFRNAGHGRINVVYRRKDGNIGWIDPPASGTS